MKFLNNCTAAFAAGLSRNYLSPARYDASLASLPEYLGETGILLSMCITGSCDPNDNDYEIMDHWSGSWIQNKTTGPRVFSPGGFEDPVAGVIIDAKEVHIRCVYPVDAATVSRESNGCGVLEDFSNQVSFLERWNVRLRVTAYKIAKFGWRRKWDSIPCSEFFDGFSGDDGSNMLRSPVLVDKKYTWKTWGYLDGRILGDIMGHPVCYDDGAEPDFNSPLQLVLYAGDDSWRPMEWQQSTDVTERIISEHPDIKGLWNEVVMDNPVNTRKAVRAVFYINPSARELAEFEAERLGGKPVLKLDPFDMDQIFQCPPKRSPDSETDVVAVSEG